MEVLIRAEALLLQLKEYRGHNDPFFLIKQR